MFANTIIRRKSFNVFWSVIYPVSNSCFPLLVFSEKSGVPFRLKDPVKVEGLQLCENCCQYGNVDECLSGGNYCSQNCARHIKDKQVFCLSVCLIHLLNGFLRPQLQCLMPENTEVCAPCLQSLIPDASGDCRTKEFGHA